MGPASQNWCKGLKINILEYINLEFFQHMVSTIHMILIYSVLGLVAESVAKVEVSEQPIYYALIFSP